MHELTSPAMTVLGVQWLLPVQGVCDLAAVASPTPLDGPEFEFSWDCVWRTMLPCFVFGEELMGAGPLRGCAFCRHFRLVLESQVKWADDEDIRIGIHDVMAMYTQTGIV